MKDPIAQREKSTINDPGHRLTRSAAAFDAGDVLEFSAPLLAKRQTNRVEAGLACAPISALTPLVAEVEEARRSDSSSLSLISSRSHSRSDSLQFLTIA